MPIEKTAALIVAGNALMPPAGLVVANYLDPDVHRFRGKDRIGRPVTEVVIHETVTRSLADTVTVLKRRRLGVHLIVAPDGRVTQHADLAHDRVPHARGHNTGSVGIEIVTPYHGRLLKHGLPWTRVVDAPWAEGGDYVLLTPEQAEAVAKLIRWLTSEDAEGLSIPRRWIGFDAGQLAMGRVEGANEPKPGIYAHTFWNHADGAWPVLYSWLRLEAGFAPCRAYEVAALLAETAPGSVDVGDMLRTPSTCVSPA